MSVRIRKGENLDSIKADASKAKDAEPIASEPSTVPGTKQPPPEKPSDIQRRSYIILSFWLIVILLGLPIWWQTTTIYRANLPLAEMLEWADGKVGKALYP
jgi:GPI-anchor transamidase subunit S